MKATYTGLDGKMRAERRRDRLPQPNPKFIIGLNVLKWLILPLVFLVGLHLTGCAAREKIVYQTVYQDVYIPVQCKVYVPEKPQPQPSAALMTIDLIEYTESLRLALLACTIKE